MPKPASGHDADLVPFILLVPEDAAECLPPYSSHLSNVAALIWNYAEFTESSEIGDCRTRGVRHSFALLRSREVQKRGGVRN
jgi:hypothetical protein